MLHLDKHRALERILEPCMITPDGWFSWAIRDPGYPGGVNGGRNTVRGVAPHSAEGNFLSLEHLHDFHWGRATAPPGERASWGATNLKDGRFIEHYSIYAQTWTSGAGYPNNNFFAFENEGKAGEPLTDAQVDNIVRVICELSELQGWTPRRPDGPFDKVATLYEHNECVRWGAAPTACPSGRIPWDRIMEKVMGVTKEEFAELFKYVQRVDAAVKFIIPGFINLAGQVYGDDDPKTLDLKQRVDALEKDK